MIASSDLGRVNSTEETFVNDNTLAASQILQDQRQSLRGTGSTQDDSSKRCCWGIFYKLNSFIWQNQVRLLKSDHLQAAPCVTSNFLAVLRICISVMLIVQTLFTIFKTSQEDSSFQFISQWNLCLITILFTTMACVQVKHSRRLTNFRMDVKQQQRSTSLTDLDDGVSIAMMESTDLTIETPDSGSHDNPWAFWKWMIPIYASALCVGSLLALSFWVTVFKSTEFLLYIGDDNKIIWDLLPTLPPALMLIEWPFNMIPFDWPMLIFVELLFTFYLLLNFIIVSAEQNHTNVYRAFDWYQNPWAALGAALTCYVILAFEFAVFWWITNKWKLPKYQQRRETRLGSISSTAGSEKDLDTSEDNLMRLGSSFEKPDPHKLSINNQSGVMSVISEQDEDESSSALLNPPSKAKVGFQVTAPSGLSSMSKSAFSNYRKTATQSTEFEDSGNYSQMTSSAVIDDL